jgi:hypothetical protein
MAVSKTEKDKLRPLEDYILTDKLEKAAMKATLDSLSETMGKINTTMENIKDQLAVVNSTKLEARIVKLEDANIAAWKYIDKQKWVNGLVYAIGAFIATGVGALAFQWIGKNILGL